MDLKKEKEIAFPRKTHITLYSGIYHDDDLSRQSNAQKATSSEGAL
jgi:hypothetical protein